MRWTQSGYFLRSGNRVQDLADDRPSGLGPGVRPNYGTEGMIERPVGLALSDSFGFGGHNVCLAIKRFDG